MHKNVKKLNSRLYPLDKRKTPEKRLFLRDFLEIRREFKLFLCYFIPITIFSWIYCEKSKKRFFLRHSGDGISDAIIQKDSLKYEYSGEIYKEKMTAQDLCNCTQCAKERFSKNGLFFLSEYAIIFAGFELAGRPALQAGRNAAAGRKTGDGIKWGSVPRFR